MGTPSALHASRTWLFAFKRNGGSGYRDVGGGRNGYLYIDGSNVVHAVAYFGGTAGSELGTGIFTAADLTDYIVAIVNEADGPGTFNVYVNGSVTTFTGLYDGGGGTDDATMLGHYAPGATSFFTGTIYQAAVLTAPITSAQVAALTKQGNWQTELGVTNSAFGAWWRLKGNAQDSGPNGINGTVVGTPTYL